MIGKTLRVMTLAGAVLGATASASQAFPFFGRDDGGADMNNSGQVAGALPRNEDGQITLRHLRGHQDRSAERAAYRGEAVGPAPAQQYEGDEVYGSSGRDAAPAGAYGTAE